MEKYFKCKKNIYYLLIITLLCSSAIGCKSQEQALFSENVIRLTTSGTPKIDPAVGNDESSTTAIVNIYDSLVFPDYDGSIKPLVARKWDIDEEGLKYTFYLNEGIKFHNGDELTAGDVAFSMERLLTIGEGFAYLFSDVVQNVSVIDDYTVEFTLKNPFGPFLSILPRLYILNESQVVANTDDDDSYGEMGDYGKGWLLTNDAGSGPYIVKELQQQSYLYATKFDDYWRDWGEDAPEAIKIIDTTEGATVRGMMINKELEITDLYQTEENIHAMEKLPGVSIAKFSIGSQASMFLNNKKEPLDDVHFRKALAHMFDYDLIGNRIHVFCKRATGPVPSGVVGHNQNIYQYNLDLEKAQEYLSMSKYKDKIDEYTIEFAVPSGVPEFEKVALAFQASAQKAGIKVEVSQVPWITMTELVSTPETTPHICYIDIPINYNEAGAMLYSRYHSSTVGTWEQPEWLQDSEIDKLIDNSLRTIDKEERVEKYKEIQRILVEEICPTIWIRDTSCTCVYRSDRIYWPIADLFEKENKLILMPMGYHYYFKDFKIHSDDIDR